MGKRSGKSNRQETFRSVGPEDEKELGYERRQAGELARRIRDYVFTFIAN